MTQPGASDSVTDDSRESDRKRGITLLRERVLVVGDSIRLVSKAKSADVDVVYMQKPSQFDPTLIPHCRQLVLVDYQHVPSATAMAVALHDIAPITRIVTQTEAAQLVAGHLTDVLGIPGTSERCARLLHDKSAMRALLNEQGIGPVPYAVNPTHAQLREFVTSHGASIVKPTTGSGSLGVRRVESVEDVDAVWAWCRSFGLSEFQVEKLLTGPELSVESFSRSGRHTIIAVTAKDTDHGTVELGHVVPAPLADDQLDRIRELTTRLLDAVGLEDGPSHTEIILTDEGPRIVESHTRRGGDHINGLVRMVYGVDMEEATYRLVGHGEPLDGHLHPARGAAAIRFLTASPGVVTSVTGVDAARAVDGVEEVSVSVEAGSVVPELRWSDDRCGHVIVRADDADTAVRLARKVAGQIAITTEPAAEDATGPDTEAPATLSAILRPYDEVFDPFT